MSGVVTSAINVLARSIQSKRVWEYSALCPSTLAPEEAKTCVGVVDGRHIKEKLTDSRYGLQDEDEEDTAPETVEGGRPSRDLLREEDAEERGDGLILRALGRRCFVPARGRAI